MVNDNDLYNYMEQQVKKLKEFLQTTRKILSMETDSSKKCEYVVSELEELITVAQEKLRDLKANGNLSQDDVKKMSENRHKFLNSINEIKSNISSDSKKLLEGVSGEQEQKFIKK